MNRSLRIEAADVAAAGIIFTSRVAVLVVPLGLIPTALLVTMNTLLENAEAG